LIVAANSAEAFTCGSTPDTWKDGYYTDTNSSSATDYYGTHMQVDVQSVGLCSGGSNQFSAVWEAIAAEPSSPVLGIAQSGYEKEPSGQPHAGLRDFAQFINGSYIDTYYSSGTLTTGTTRGYRTELHTSNCVSDCTLSYANGSLVLQDPFPSGWSGPYSIQISGEARYRLDDVAGVASNHARMADLQYFSSTDFAFHTMPCNIFVPHSDSDNWHHDAVSCTQKDIWSDPTN
jgi:hypothetical protein